MEETDEAVNRTNVELKSDVKAIPGGCAYC